MKVNSDFEIKHFVNYTKLYGGVLEIVHSTPENYTAIYKEDAFSITPEALNKIKILNQNLKIQNRIVQ